MDGKGSIASHETLASRLPGAPYAYVRHPLYLFEQISFLGVSLQFREPWASLIVLISIGLQFPRMRFEESVLAEVFPAYRAYRARTPLFLPRLMS